MDGRIDDHTVRPLLTEPIDTTLSAMNGSIVDDREHAPGLVIGRLCHDLGNQTVERLDPGFRTQVPNTFARRTSQAAM